MLLQFPALLLTGVRQTGKTTLLRHLLPDYHFVSLDLPGLAELAEQNPQGFFETHPPPVVIDEAQYAPALFRHLKVLIDRDRGAKGRFVLTGSQKFTSMRGVAESLAGRLGLAELDTLSAAEVLASQPGAFDPGIPRDLARVLVCGTFPELWEDVSLDATELYRAYVATYLERDVRTLLRVGSLRDFERFLRLCAARSGELLNKSSLARDVGVSVPTIGEWISVLQASRQVMLLEPHLENLGKRVVESPKLYLHDTELQCFLLNLDERSLLGVSPIVGAVWETFVLNQIVRDLAFRTTRADVWFWRDQQQREVDFLISTSGMLRPIEVKWSEHPGPTEVRKLAQLGELLGDRALRGWIACPTATSYPRAEGTIEVINPAWARAWDGMDADDARSPSPTEPTEGSSRQG